MRFSLPDEDAREKAAGEALPFRIDRFKEVALAVSPQACLHRQILTTAPFSVSAVANASSSGLPLCAPHMYAALTECSDEAGLYTGFLGDVRFAIAVQLRQPVFQGWLALHASVVTSQRLFTVPSAGMARLLSCRS